MADEWQNVYGITPDNWLITYGGGPTGGYFKRHIQPNDAVFVAWHQGGLSSDLTQRTLVSTALQFKAPDEDNMYWQVREVPMDLAPSMPYRIRDFNNCIIHHQPDPDVEVSPPTGVATAGRSGGSPEAKAKAKAKAEAVASRSVSRWTA
jgi:hypothetical protein